LPAVSACASSGRGAGRRNTLFMVASNTKPLDVDAREARRGGTVLLGNARYRHRSDVQARKRGDDRERSPEASFAPARAPRNDWNILEIRGSTPKQSSTGSRPSRRRRSSADVPVFGPCSWRRQDSSGARRLSRARARRRVRQGHADSSARATRHDGDHARPPTCLTPPESRHRARRIETASKRLP
jgi:hypothetical protein